MGEAKVLYSVHPSSVRFYTPINAVLKNSDKNRARTITDIIITDQTSLTRASDIPSWPLASLRLRFVLRPTTQLLASTHLPNEIAKMGEAKVLYPVHPSSVQFYTPINAVLKNSDKNRTRTIADINITD